MNYPGKGGGSVSRVSFASSFHNDLMHSELAAFLKQKLKIKITTVCYFENVNSIFIAC